MSKKEAINIEQISIFDLLYETYQIKKPIRLIEFFAGIGSQAKALERMGVDFEHWKISEWAIPSILAYKEIHSNYLPNNVNHSKDLTKEQLVDYLLIKGISKDYNKPMQHQQISKLPEQKIRDIYNAILTENNLVNIRQVKGKDLNIIDSKNFTYLLTYSFPCQDLSLAGKGKGMSKNSGTRSGMLWEVERILLECNEIGELPQVLLMENVPEVISQKNIKDFQKWELQLEQLGYKNYINILNAKDYGIPQNRRRCFMVSILGDYVYNFPKKKTLTLRLKDMLEDKVDEKYYLSNKAIQGMKSTSFVSYKLENQLKDLNGCASTIVARFEGAPQCIATTEAPICLNSKGGRKGIEGLQPSLQDRVYSIYGISTALNTSFMPSILIPEATKKRYAAAYEGDGVYINRPHQKRGVVQKAMIQTIKTSPDCGVVVAADQRSRGEVGNSITTDAILTKNIKKDVCETKELKIRKLTPKECYRLMGFDDEDYEAVKKVLADTWIYHTAGDSIVVNVLEAIFKEFYSKINDKIIKIEVDKK